jgi:hypothetical protein
MIGERSELLARLLRYNSLVRGMADNKAREALRTAIAAIERRLAELDRASMRDAPPEEEERRPLFRAR